jgi:molecular chaperone HtpG
VGAAEERESPTSSTRRSTSTSPTISRIRSRGRTRASRSPGVHALLYLPARAPFDLWDRDARHGSQALRAARVHHGRRRAAAAPYLRFVRGVVDSNDLPLNISREILQESKDIEAIRGGCTRKVLSLLEEIAANDKDKYAKFWDAFGTVLKEGVGEDFANKERIAGLLRFASTHATRARRPCRSPTILRARRKGQDKIYYVTAETFNAARNSPHLEIFRKKGIEVCCSPSASTNGW